MGWYKLNGYDYSQWNYWRNEYPKNHIEDIVKDTEGASWITCTNFSLDRNSMDQVTAKGTKDQFPFYIKYEDIEGTAWYYFRSGIVKTLNTNKQGKLEYYATYSIDMYQTVWQKKLAKLRVKNPQVFAKFAFGNRLKSDSMKSKYWIDLVKDQKYLGNWVNLTEIEKVRTNISKYTESTYFDLQGIDNVTYSQITDTFTSYFYYSKDDETGYNLPVTHNWGNLLKSTRSKGKYQYIVCKASSWTKGTHGYDFYDTSCSIILIPLFDSDYRTSIKLANVEGNTDSLVTFTTEAWNGLSETERAYLNNPIAHTPSQVLNGLNNLNPEATNFYAFLNPTGDNFIGIWTTDIPFCLLPYKTYDPSTYLEDKLIYAYQDGKWILGYTLNFTDPLAVKILREDGQIRGDGQDLATRLSYIANNTDKLLPETEPWLLHPNMYNEVFNNGVSGVNLDLSLIKPTITSLTSNFYVSVDAYLNPLNNLGIAYRFNEPNTYNSGYDNTNSLVSDIGQPSMFFGSSASTYLTQNLTTLTTAQANIQDQQRLDSMNYAMKTTSNIFKTIFNPTKWLTIGTDAMTTAAEAQTMDTQHKMQWRDYNSQVQNLKAAPSQTLSTKSEKSCLPHVNQDKPIFEWYAMEACDKTKNMYFQWYLHNGYPYNDFLSFNNIENRQYMNVYSIAGEVSGEYILEALNDGDNDFFNDERFNKAFLLWLEGVNHIYTGNTWVNVLNWKADDYVHNIEKNL